MNAKRAAKLMRIARYYGEERQVCKLIEELGEAVSAASELQMMLSFREDSGKKRICRSGWNIWRRSWQMCRT